MAFDPSTLFNAPRYADLIVEYGPDGSRKELYCHKAVVCPQSKFLEIEYAAARARQLSEDGKLRIALDCHYDRTAVEFVLRAMYRQKHETGKSLEDYMRAELLPIFEVIHLLRLDDLGTTIRALVSHNLDRISGAKALRNARKVFQGQDRRPLIVVQFSGEIRKLQQRLKDSEDEQIEIMKLLRDPETREEVSEMSYQKFLDAVEHSSWPRLISG